MRKRTILVAAVAGVSALTASVLVATPAAQGATPRSIPNTAPAWTAHARHLGQAAGSGAVQAKVYLAPRGGVAAVQRKAMAVSTPGNAQYGKFLTAAQYYAAFAPTASTVRAVSKWLRSSGLRVTGVAAHNRYISVIGSVAAAEKAFATRIDRYSKNGAAVQAPATTLKAPASVGTAVLTVTGLDTSAHLATPASKPAAAPPAGFRNGRPCSIYYGQLSAKNQADYHTPLPQFRGQTLYYAPCGYTGAQYRSAYEHNSALDGSGVTVAITDAYAAPTIKSDAETYADNHGDGSYANGQFSQTKLTPFTNAAECGPSGWYGEETLDVEAVHAMAPGANIHFYGAASCEDSDLLGALTQVVDDDTAQLVTNSWGEPEEVVSTDLISAFEDVFLQGAIEGISFMFSSGDNGDEVANTGIKQADWPVSDPYVTGVGGTSDAIGPNGGFAAQTGWGTNKFSLNSSGTGWTSVGYLYGAGGGTSSLFNRPAYQDGFTSSGGRQVPDVAMDADPNTGMLVGETQTFPDGVYYDEYRIGGTSLASPLFAGMTALSLQSAGHAVGLLNPTVYANPDAFTDIKGAPPQPGEVRVDYANGVDGTDGLVYSVRTFDQDSSLRAVNGYDLVTGLGAANSAWLSAVS